MGKGSRVFSMIVVLATCQVLSAFRMDGARADFKSTPVFMTTTLAPTSPKFEVQEAVEPNLLTYDSVFLFGKSVNSKEDKSKKNMKFLLGGKGANLADMSAIGLSVPPGFTITTEVCSAFHKTGKKLPKNTWNNVLNGLKSIETEMGRGFGEPNKPLLVSVRSGAAVSMPGMMDTVLNLGLNDDTVEGLAKSFGARFALDSYRRFLNMFGCVVFNIPHNAFEDVLSRRKQLAKVIEDSELTEEHLRALIEEYKNVYQAHGYRFVTNPLEQLYTAITAVFDSWHSERAIKYREAEAITGLLGTAVNIQAMVFGNMGEDSGTGVCFTRNPNTGENKLYGEYLINAQGEDVVAGIRTPNPIATLKFALPEAYDELMTNVGILEKYYHDMQDIEFTIQQKKLYMLQTRGGKRTGAAAVKIANDMVSEGLATKDQAILTVKPEHLNQLLHPQFTSTKTKNYQDRLIAKGLPASPGAAVGVVVFSPAAAEARFAKGEKCILVRDDTSPEDVGGMWASEGILTSRGGMTSHAAVVARGWGKPCICGCGDMHLDEESQLVTFTTSITGPDGLTKKVVHTVREGDFLSLNGDTGEVLIGQLPLSPPSLESSQDTSNFMKWVDETRVIHVLANADSPIDAIEARRNGAQGIGLTRTEHMFFSDERIRVVRRMILSQDPANKKRALDELLVYQRKDFEGILEAMDGLPVTVRLLDPPLHEFLPKEEYVDEAFASDVGLSVEGCLQAIRRMHEVNPMLGLRGCRLGVVLPELIAMQTRALIEAALHNKHNKGLNPMPEVMIPLVGSASEFSDQAKLIRDTAQQVFADWGGKTVTYRLGTMIEVPRAALTADEIAAAGAEFFSYGTNDLTQMTFGFSRDDVGTYLPTYLRKGLLDQDPFEVIDERGVGSLIKSSVALGRKATTLASFKVGVCGEHGGDPTSVRFFARSGLNYVSCSPLRVPIARLAAAQVVIEDRDVAGQKEQIKKIPPKALSFDDDSDKKTFVVTRTFSPKRSDKKLFS